MLAFREKQFHCTINVGRKGSDVVFEKIAFRVHAIQRMYERSITAEEVHTVIQTGEIMKTIRMIFLIPAVCYSDGAVYDRSTSLLRTMHMIRKTSW